MSVFIPISKKGNAKICSNYCIIVLTSQASKVVLNSIQIRLQQYVNWEISDVQARFRKGRGIRYKTAYIHWIKEKEREFQKNIYFCFIDSTKAFDCVDDNKLWKILIEKGISDHLTFLLRILYVGQEVTVRTGHAATGRCKIEKGLCQDCILSPCLCNFNAEYISQNAKLDESHAGINIVERSISNFRYENDNTLRQKMKRN